MSEDVFHLGIKALIRDKLGRVLLLQANPVKLNEECKEYWDLPGGRVQKNQTVLNTLMRELAEETGITTIESNKEVGMVISNIRIPLAESDTAGLILGVYECVAANYGNIVLSDEHVAYNWFVPKEAADLLEIKYPKHFCELIAEL